MEGGMISRLLVGACTLGVAASCSSSTEGTGTSACADISGNYRVTSTRAGGSCVEPPNSSPESTASFSRNQDGTWSLLMSGITGDCPGTLDKACKFIANCTGTGEDGATVATFNIEYTFTGSTFKGTTVGGLRPPAVPAACDVTYQETGSKL